RIPAVLRLVRDARQARLVEGQYLEELGIPAFRVEVEEPGAGGDREAAGRRSAQELLVEVVAEGDEPRRAAEDVRVRLGEPRELRRPEARVDVCAGASLDGARVDAPAKPLGGAGAARVTPAEYRRQRLAVGAERESTRLNSSH